jgi:DNA-binding MarR family transcriptional regulator
MHASGVDRVANLLGVVALAVVDRLREATENALSAGGGAAAAAVVHLEAEPGESVSRLAQVLGLSQTGAVRLLDRLAGLGLVERAAGADGRTRAVRLTSAGSARAEQIRIARTCAVRQVLAGLDEEELAALTSVLEHLVRRLPPNPTATRDDPDWLDVLHLCRLCDRSACRQNTGCPLRHEPAPDQRP